MSKKIRWTRKSLPKQRNSTDGCWEHNGWIDGVQLFNVTVSDGTSYPKQILAYSRVRGLWSTREPDPRKDFEKPPEFGGDRGGVYSPESSRESWQYFEQDRTPYETPEDAMRDVETQWEAWKTRFC